MRNVTLKIANPISYSMIYIVGSMVLSVGKRAIDYLVERGSECPIDNSPIFPVLEGAGIGIGNEYLEAEMRKYCGKQVGSPTDFQI